MVLKLYHSFVQMNILTVDFVSLYILILCTTQLSSKLLQLTLIP